MTESTPEMRIKSADDLIVGEEARKLGTPLPTPTPEPENTGTEEKAESNIDQASETEADGKEEKETEQQPENREQDKSSDDTPSSDENVDEYGNAVAKKKTYTEEEVQAMIRKRVRDKHAEQPAPVQTPPAQPAQADTDESWRHELKEVIKETTQEVQAEEQRKQQERAQAQRTAEFELKFETGMAKYKDFENIVSGKPITGAMMAATGEMTDPAAFLYAACKQNPGEIERIAKLQSATAQMVEIGRLEERMKKAKLITHAPTPAKRISGDASSEMPKLDIDQRIASHAKSKIINNRK